MNNIIPFPKSAKELDIPVPEFMEMMALVKLDKEQIENLIYDLELECSFLDNQIIEDEMEHEELYYIVEQRYYLTLLKNFLKEKEE